MAGGGRNSAEHAAGQTNIRAGEFNTESSVRGTGSSKFFCDRGAGAINNIDSEHRFHMK